MYEEFKNSTISLIIYILFKSATEEERIEARKAMMNSELYGGDMLGIPKDGFRNIAMNTLQNRWTNGTIPYIIDSSLGKIDESLIYTTTDTTNNSIAENSNRERDEQNNESVKQLH